MDSVWPKTSLPYGVANKFLFSEWNISHSIAKLRKNYIHFFLLRKKAHFIDSLNLVFLKGFRFFFTDFSDRFYQFFLILQIKKKLWILYGYILRKNLPKSVYHIFCVFFSLPKLFSLLIKVSKVTNEYQKGPKMVKNHHNGPFFFPKGKNTSALGQSSLQELEVGPHSEPYLLVLIQYFSRDL